MEELEQAVAAFNEALVHTAERFEREGRQDVVWTLSQMFESINATVTSVLIEWDKVHAEVK